MKYIQTVPRISILILALSLILAILTVVILGKSAGLMFVCIGSVLAGMAMFLKSKDIAIKQEEYLSPWVCFGCLHHPSGYV